VFTVRKTPAFDAWLLTLADLRARAKILMRLNRAERGNLGDCAPVGEGVSEMRINFGPGYRVYFLQRENGIDVLAGGDKSSQRGDIKKALALAREVKEQDQ
jgi:putative addiction module killer protein